MIPMRTSSIFKSRWMALVWAAGILWAAYDFVGPEPQDEGNNSITTDAAGSAVSTDDQNRIAAAFGN